MLLRWVGTAAICCRFSSRPLWGFDTNQALILAGVMIELPRVGVTPDHGAFFAIRNRPFQRSTGFEFAISDGLFSRLPLNRVARVWRGHAALGPRGRFYATWSRTRIRATSPDYARRLTFADAEPYHYPFLMLKTICDAVGARVERVETGSAHPRGESLIVITPLR